MPHKDLGVRRAYEKRYKRVWQNRNREHKKRYEREWHKKNPGYESEMYKKKIKTGAEQAKQTVRNMVNIGNLARLSETFVPCVDCGERAAVYDHRDYNKPLEVDPVCRSCNWKRGPATPRREVI